MKLMAWAMIGCAVGLAACQSNTHNANQPQFLTQKIYHAPAQSYSFDLGSTTLRGELDLKQACSITGSSLDIRDQLNQQVRIDTINLNHNPQLQITGTSPLKEVAPAVLALYQNKYQATATTPHGYKSHVGDVAISRLTNQQKNVDLLIFTQYNYAYIVQLNSPLLQTDAEKAKQQLQILLKSMQIPGKALVNASNPLPISFDLSNTDSSARAAWQKTYCS